MKFKELQAKSIDELKKLLNEQKEELRVMRFKVEQRQLKKVHEIKNVRRTIARISTIINQKQKEEPKS